MVTKEEIKNRMNENKKTGVYVLYPEGKSKIYIYESSYLMKLAIKNFEDYIPEKDRKTEDWMYDDDCYDDVPRFMYRVNSYEELLKYLDDNNLNIADEESCWTEFA